MKKLILTTALIVSALVGKADDTVTSAQSFLLVNAPFYEGELWHKEDSELSVVQLTAIGSCIGLIIVIGCFFLHSRGITIGRKDYQTHLKNLCLIEYEGGTSQWITSEEINDIKKPYRLIKRLLTDEQITVINNLD